MCQHREDQSRFKSFESLIFSCPNGRVAGAEQWAKRTFSRQHFGRDSSQLLDQTHKRSKLLGWWNSDRAFNFLSLIVKPPCCTLYPTHDSRERTKRKLPRLKGMLAVRAVWRMAQTPATCTGKVWTNQSKSSTTKTVLDSDPNATSARLLYSSPEQPINAMINL